MSGLTPAYRFFAQSRPVALLGLSILMFMLLLPFSVRQAHGFASMAAGQQMVGAQSVHRHDAINRIIEKEYRLNRDGTWNMRLHFVTQVLTFNGLKENSDFRFQYNPAFEEVKVTLARTTTAHGKVVEVNPKEINDITDPSIAGASLFASSRVKVISFPSVDLGTTVELVIEKRSQLPFWAVESFRLKDPTLIKQVMVEVPDGLSFKYRLDEKGVRFKQESLAGQGGYVRYTWSAKDLLPMKQEPRRPPLVNSGHCLVMAAYEDWSQALSFVRQGLEKAADAPFDASLFEFPDDPDAIFRHLQRRLKVLRLPLLKGGLTFQSPQECLDRAMGTQFDVCLLFKAIVEKKGLQADILLAASDGAMLDEVKEVPAVGLLDTALVRCNGRFYSFDSRNMPPGVTDMAGQLAYDVLGAGWTVIIDRPPALKSAAWQVELKGTDLAQVRYFRMDSGAESQTLRAIFKDLTPEEFDLRKRMFLFSLSPSVKEGGHLWVFGEEDLAPSVGVRADFEMESPLIELKDGTLLYPVRFSQVLEALGRLMRKRENPLFIRQAQAARFVLDLALPAGFRVVAMPQPGSGSKGLLSWKVSSRQSGRHVYISASFDIERGILPAGAPYQEFRKALGELLDPAKWVVTLKRD